MIRCPTCNALHPEGESCPGCLVGLALSGPPERSNRTALFALALGLTLGASVCVTAVAAVVTWNGQAAVASSTPDVETLEELRDGLEEERLRLAAERRTLEAERARLEEAREALDAAAARSDQEVVWAEANQAKSREAAEQARERALAAERDARLRAEEAASRAAEAAHRARAAQEQAGAAQDRARAAAEAASAAATQRAQDTGCEDLVALEVSATLGHLTEPHRACLLGRRDDPGSSSSSTASRLLMLDAYSAGEIARWEALIRHHLEHIEPDGDLAYKLALHCQKTMKYADCERFAEMALAHRDTWTGKTYVARVSTAYEIRHQARLALHGPSDPRTQAAAEEWKEFQAVGRPLTNGLP